MKKLISIILVLITVLSLGTTAFASNADHRSIEPTNQYVKDISKELYNERYEIAKCWTHLVETGEISIQADGKFALNNKSRIDKDMYQYIVYILNAYNDAIEIGAIKVSVDSNNNLQYALQGVDEKTLTEMREKYERASVSYFFTKQ